MYTDIVAVLCKRSAPTLSLDIKYILMNERIPVMNSSTGICNEYPESPWLQSNGNGLNEDNSEREGGLLVWWVVCRAWSPIRSQAEEQRWNGHETSSYHIVVIGNKFNGTSLYRNWIYWMANASLSRYFFASIHKFTIFKNHQEEHQNQWTCFHLH